jgi:hypothetical protein
MEQGVQLYFSLHIANVFSSSTSTIPGGSAGSPNARLHGSSSTPDAAASTTATTSSE